MPTWAMPGTIEPRVVAKRQRRLAGVSDLVISLVAKGLTTGEVAAHLAEIYDIEVSRETISNITDRERDVLGLWAGEHGDGEGAKFWLRVLTEIKNRGVADVCIVVCDGLKGLPDSINTTWNYAQVQACILHLLRNTFRYASRRDWDELARDLKPVYTAPNTQMAAARFEEFADKWTSRYPAVVNLWRAAWQEFIVFLDYDVEIRKIICSTNAIESLNARYRRAVRARGYF